MKLEAQQGKSSFGGRCGCEVKRKRILECAAAAFAEDGFYNVKTDDIAAAAEVGKGTLFRYFSTKEELFLSTVIYCSEQVLAEVDSALAGVESPLSRLEAICECLASFYRKNHHFFYILHHHEGFNKQPAHKEYHQKQGALCEKVADVIADGQKSGDIFEVDPHFAARMLLGMFRTAMWNPKSRELASCELGKNILSFFLDGVRRR